MVLKIGDHVKTIAHQLHIIGYSVPEHCFFIRMFKNRKATSRITVSALVFGVPQKFYYKLPMDQFYDGPKGYRYQVKLDGEYYIYHIPNKELYKNTGWLELINVHEIDSWTSMDNEILKEKGVIRDYHMRDHRKLSNKQPAMELLDTKIDPFVLEGAVESISLLAIEFSRKKPYGNRFVIIKTVKKISELILKKEMRINKRILKASVIVNTETWSYTINYLNLIKVK